VDAVCGVVVVGVVVVVEVAGAEGDVAAVAVMDTTVAVLFTAVTGGLNGVVADAITLAVAETGGTGPTFPLTPALPPAISLVFCELCAECMALSSLEPFVALMSASAVDIGYW
jgi:hypothetical protein